MSTQFDEELLATSSEARAEAVRTIDIHKRALQAVCDHDGNVSAAIVALTNHAGDGFFDPDELAADLLFRVGLQGEAA